MDEIKVTIMYDKVKSDLRAAARFITGDEPQSKYLRIGLELLADYAQPDGYNGTTFPGLVREVVMAHLLESARRLQKSARAGGYKIAASLRAMGDEVRNGVDVTPDLPAAHPPDPMGFDCALGPCCHCDPLTRGKCDA